MKEGAPIHHWAVENPNRAARPRERSDGLETCSVDRTSYAEERKSDWKGVVPPWNSAAKGIPPSPRSAADQCWASVIEILLSGCTVESVRWSTET